MMRPTAGPAKIKAEFLAQIACGIFAGVTFVAEVVLALPPAPADLNSVHTKTLIPKSVPKISTALGGWE
jgi:hypothetical protein